MTSDFLRHQVPFFLSANSETSSLSDRMAGRYGFSNSINVTAVDLAAFVRRAASALPAPELLFLKLDVEGIEAQLLPFLLAEGALCKLTHLLIEWHLNAISPEQRLDALALKMALPSMLYYACRRKPPRLEYEALIATDCH